ncbi:hypothetical protein K438DRAFT_2008686 [Mycena galopus ATCC 62051]|nr:hypothetical protein K438DRAFT_2008686 [Mycena galopus ATCC 62051]
MDRRYSDLPPATASTPPRALYPTRHMIHPEATCLTGQLRPPPHLGRLVLGSPSFSRYPICAGSSSTSGEGKGASSSTITRTYAPLMPLTPSPSIALCIRLSTCAGRRRACQRHVHCKCLKPLSPKHIKSITSILTRKTPSNTKGMTATLSIRSPSVNDSHAVPSRPASIRVAPRLLAALACHGRHDIHAVGQHHPFPEDGRSERVHAATSSTPSTDHPAFPHHISANPTHAPTDAIRQRTSPAIADEASAMWRASVPPTTREPAVILRNGDATLTSLATSISTARPHPWPRRAPTILPPKPIVTRTLRPKSRSVALWGGRASPLVLCRTTTG